MNILTSKVEKVKTSRKKMILISSIIMALIVCLVIINDLTNDNPIYPDMPNRMAAKMPKCEKMVFHDFDPHGVQTALWYIQYYYGKSMIGFFSKEKIFTEVSEENIGELYGYFYDYETWLEGEKKNDNYDFNYKKQVGIGDYYVIFAKKFNDERDKYNYYSIYFYDVEKNILYFFHEKG